MASKAKEATSLLLMLLAATAFSGFTIIPEDVTVTISASAGSTRVARFFCQPYAADNIFWLVNGTHPQDLPFPTGITTCSNALPNGTQGQRIYTLKIEARLEYNETTIVCAAVYFSRSTPVEFSNPEAQLIIFESEHAQSFPTGFAQRPMSLTLAIGERAIFTCQHCATNAIIWRLDGIKLRYNSLPPGIISSYIYPEVQSLCGVIYLLTIKQIVAHNNTMISCEANINSRVPNEASDSALLLTQGQLSQVTDLIRNTSSNPHPESVIYTWKAPYSLNLTNAEPDIAYCVRVYNVTCPTGANVNEVNNCSITQPYLKIPKNFGGDAVYEIEVIARTNLEVGLEHVNGTNSTEYRDKFVSFNHTLVTYNISVVTHETVKVLVHLNLQGIEPSNVIPNEIEIRLFEIDVAVNDGVLESNDIIICPTNLSNLSTTEAGAIKYATFNLNCPTPLKIKRLYLSSVHIPTPYCTINSSSSIELSTHLIQNVTVASMPHSGAIVISGDILTVNISNITVLGFLAIAYTNHSDSAPLYGIGTLSGDEQNANVSLSSSPGKQYRASIFSIEHTGLPSKKSINKAQPAIDTDEEIPGIRNVTPGFNASLDRNGCVKCFFSDDSFTSLLRSCVVIASNRTQINSTNGITYIDVFEFRREGKTASGCINMSTNDFDIFAFTFAEGMPSISGQGLTVTPIIEDQPDEQNMIILFTVSATLVIILGVLVIALLFITLILPKKHHRARIHSDTAAVHDAYWEDEVKTNASHEHFILKKQHHGIDIDSCALEQVTGAGQDIEEDSVSGEDSKL